MNLREQRGMELAATRTIRKRDGWWLVPSQTGSGMYRVQLAPKFATCECPDFGTRGGTCKHIFAATFVMKREQNADGSTTVTQTATFTATKRTTYPQDWAAYNAAQTNEKDKFQALLRDLCRGVAEPQAQKLGRPRLPISDAIFSATFKVYSTVSARRFMSDLREAQARGFITKTPHFNSIFNYLENASMTPILQSLITQSSLPLTAVETDFAADPAASVLLGLPAGTTTSTARSGNSTIG